MKDHSAQQPGTGTTAGDAPAPHEVDTDLVAAAAGARRVPGLDFPLSRRTDPVSVRPGVRVVVRRVTGRLAESCRPEVSDVIGTLLRVDPLVVRPAPRKREPGAATQEPVEIAAGSVVVLKTLSTKPVRNSDIRGVEEAVAEAFPGIENAWVEGWLCRAGDGITERSNTAVPLGPNAALQPVPVEGIKAFYAQHELPAALMVPDRIGRTAENLEGTRGPEILVMTRELDDLGEAPALSGDAGLVHPNFAGQTLEIEVLDQPTEEWLSRYHFRGQPLPEQALELLRKRIDGTLGFAQVRIGGTLAAITRATITTTASGRSFLGYSAVEVLPEFRRHGLATHLGRVLLHWGAQQGATEAYLEVIESNTAGRGLYHDLGFSEHHRHRSLQLD